jgi:hypothetical protein
MIIIFKVTLLDNAGGLNGLLSWEVAGNGCLRDPRGEFFFARRGDKCFGNRGICGFEGG